MLNESRYYRVAADYEVSYEHPIKLQPGDRVQILKQDPRWPGWVWGACGGEPGWIPESVLGPVVEEHYRVAQAPFDGTELSALEGDLLEGLRAEAGWMWCRGPSGDEGWFPVYNLYEQGDSCTN